MIDQSLIEEILSNAQKSGADFAEVFVEAKKTQSITLSNQEIDRVFEGDEQGIGIRAIKGDQMSYAHTNILEEDSLLQLAEACGEAFTGVGSVDPILVHEKAPAIKREIPAVEEDIDLLREIDDYLRPLDENIKQVSLSKSFSDQHVIIANSDGLYREDTRVRQRFNSHLVLEKDHDIQTGFDSVGVSGDCDLYHAHSAYDVGEKALKQAQLLLSSKPCPGGTMPVILASEAGGTMVHEACGHGLEADLVEKGMSAYANKLSEQVAHPEITVIDDGDIPTQYGSGYYDDEGTKTQKNVLIKDGYLEKYMCDLHTSQKTGWEKTGNGRRQSYRYKPQTRMTTTYIAPGNDDPEHILRSLKKGLYVKKMGGGQVNTLNGDYVFDISEGYWVENGEIQYPVRGATLAGNGPQSLNDVQMIGNDLGYAIGVCGKGGQSAPVSDAQPTLLIDNLVVGGTEHAGT